MKLALLGAGAWGTALAISLARAHDVTLWARNAALAETLRKTRNNARYLPGYALPKNVDVEDSLTRSIAKAEVIISIVPTASLREVTKLITRANNFAPLIIASKGFETGTGKLPYEVCAETLSPDAMIGVLSGPSFAQEVAKGLPAALTLAAFNENFASETARELNGPRLRVYSSTDVIGVALGGGLKNVMAIASGISDGMGLGANARAALVTRGLAEMARLGQKLGGQAETFMGLTGLGDFSPHRHRRPLAQSPSRTATSARRIAGKNFATPRPRRRRRLLRTRSRGPRHRPESRYAHHASRLRRDRRQGIGPRRA